MMMVGIWRVTADGSWILKQLNKQNKKQDPIIIYCYVLKFSKMYVHNFLKERVVCNFLLKKIFLISRWI